MRVFESVIGHEDIKRYFEKAFLSGHIAHSYIFEGIEGVGKKTVAYQFSKILLCEGEHKPCGKCKACQLVEADNHPDLITINKDTKVTKIDSIRDKVVKEMEIKPFGKHKIMIITEADTLTVEAQNAMLKTIEEPPAYGIIILVVKNIAKLLPTIKSRCIHLRFNPLRQQDMASYLNHHGLTEEQKMVYTLFSEGSIGIAHKLLEDVEFLESRGKSIGYLERLERADLMAVYDLVKDICDEKEKIGEVLMFWNYWYRDLTLIKSINTDRLYFRDYQSRLMDMASGLTYNVINKHIDLIKQASLQIEQNIYPTFVIENLLLKLKEKKK